MDIQGLHACIISGADSESRERLAYSLAEKALGGKNYNELLPDKLTPAKPLASSAPASPAMPVLAHPDLHEISPDGTEIKVAQAREVREMAQIRPNEAPRQVFIFHDADRMNINAQNALLATIEEPPTPCLFLFVCQNERALLPTIRSRCAVIHAIPETLREYGASPQSRASDSTSVAGSVPAPQSHLSDIDPAAANRLSQALMGTLNSVDCAEATLPLAKSKTDTRQKPQGDTHGSADATASDLIEAARAACLRAAARAPAGSEAALRAIDGADFAAKCLDMLAANVSPAQVAAYIVSRTK